MNMLMQLQWYCSSTQTVFVQPGLGALSCTGDQGFTYTVVVWRNVKRAKCRHDKYVRHRGIAFQVVDQLTCYQKTQRMEHLRDRPDRWALERACKTGWQHNDTVSSETDSN